MVSLKNLKRISGLVLAAALVLGEPCILQAAAAGNQQEPAETQERLFDAAVRQEPDENQFQEGGSLEEEMPAQREAQQEPGGGRFQEPAESSGKPLSKAADRKSVV